MQKINVNLLNAYANAYDLTLKKTYSNPKIYTAKGDLNKRWYIYFSFRNPKTGALERQTPIYGGANHYKTKEERLEILNTYRTSLIKLLEQGLSPYENNDNKFESNSLVTENNKNNKNVTTIKSAFEFGLHIKKQTYKDTSFPSFKSCITKFSIWLIDNGFENKNLDTIDKKVVNEYLNFVLEKTSARTRNNYRTYISVLFKVFEDNDMVKDNFVKKISVLSSVPERHKTYSSIQMLNVLKYLEQNDEVLFLFVKLIAYAYLRPIEVCRLKVKDINFIDQRIHVRAKNSPIKIKILPDILLSDLKFLKNYNPEHFIFTPNGIANEWNLNEKGRRDYFTKRFKKVKDHLGLGKEYGLYSFRHTFITKLYKEFAKTLTPNETKSKLMLITGHKTMDALEKYLRDIDAVLPDDYSSFLK